MMRLNAIFYGLLTRYGLAVCCLIAMLMLSSIGWAQETYKEAIPMAEDPEIEKRMLVLTEDLRCLVCQNESIADSRAEFSNDIRRVIREQIKDNKTDAEIIDFLVDRYGDFVLYNPPMKPTTLLLWFGPLILFIVGSWGLYKFLKTRRVEVAEVSLSDEQRKKVEALLKEENGLPKEQQKPEGALHEKESLSEEEQPKKADALSNENKGNNL